MLYTQIREFRYTNFRFRVDSLYTRRGAARSQITAPNFRRNFSTFRRRTRRTYGVKFIFSRRCISTHVRVYARYLSRTLYTTMRGELYSAGKRCESHVSLFLLLSDNRNCIYVTQSWRKLHKDGRWISRVSPETSHVNEIAQTSTPRTTMERFRSATDTFLPGVSRREIRGESSAPGNDVTTTQHCTLFLNAGKAIVRRSTSAAD